MGHSISEKTDFIDYFDISPEISENMAVFPGDQKFERKVQLDMKKGDHIGLSSILTTLHLGSHVDAPSHYHANGETMESRMLDFYIGPCQVVTVNVARGTSIKPADIANVDIQARRVLFKTGTYPDPNQWNADFATLSPELIQYLAKAGVLMVGIDTPSIDPAESKTMDAHQVLYKSNLAVLEGVVLTEVPDAVYTLVALPLKIKQGDASPVRAILIKNPQ